MQAKQFIAVMDAVNITDPETVVVWRLIRQAVLDGYCTPAMVVSSLELLYGEADNGQSWDEFGIGADLDHWYGDHYDFSRVCVFYIQERAYCSRTQLLTAFENLQSLFTVRI